MMLTAGHLMPLAAAALAAVASLVVVHRAIFTRLAATGLVCSEAYRANRRCQNGKKELQIFFHDSVSITERRKANLIQD